MAQYKPEYCFQIVSSIAFLGLEQKRKNPEAHASGLYPWRVPMVIGMNPHE
jgi:hypothetical protein